MSDESETRPGEGPGGWFNKQTGQSMRPDLDHKPPIGPHYDLRAEDGSWWRWFPDERVEGKPAAQSDGRSCLPPGSKRLVTLPLGLAGLHYVEECLKRERGLAGCLHAQGWLAAGAAVGVVPEGTGLARALDFETGGLALHELTTAHLPEQDRMYWLADQFAAATRARPAATFVMQDVWGSTDNPRYQEATEPKFEHWERPYFVIGRQQMSADELRWAQRGIVSWYVVGFLCDIAVSEEVLATHEAHDADIEELARHVVEVICNAYDQEGFVIWRRDGAPAF